MAAPVTLLFTDLVNSTALLARAGDEQAQRIFRAHHRLLQRCVAAHDGEEVKWLGDGLMTVFASSGDAVRCAIAMQQAALRRATGERLAIRVGLNVGEVKREESDYFGTPVVIARRLCDLAQSGQILCSAIVPGLLAGQRAFEFRDVGPVAIKGLATPVAASEVLYRHDQPTALLTHTPFVGRENELRRLDAKLHETRTGSGGLTMIAGEPGIGKTRTLEEFAETARSAGAHVLWGRCYEGEAARPYGPFAEAIAEHACQAPVDALRSDLGAGAGPLARLVPALREQIPDVAEPAALQPDEERVRLLDAAAQFLIAVSVRTPLVVVLDDLHWADLASIGMLRHIARFARRHRILLLGAYRDVEVSPQHPLFDALGALPRETTYEHLVLDGLSGAEVEQLLEAVADEKVADALVSTISAETSGNPFFIREVLLHLVEEGKIVWRGGAWTSQLTGEDLGIPPGVRQVIQRRLARLPERASRLLRAAAGFSSSFRFDIVARVAQLNEAEALDAIDDALAAQLLCAAEGADSFDFTHALVRHALYAALSPPRQIRLHRQIADAMEHAYGDEHPEHAGQIAQHYHQSAGLPDAARGVPHALIAAAHAERGTAFAEAIKYLRIALDLLPQNDPTRPRLLGRLGLALIWNLSLEEAMAIAEQAGQLIGAAEGKDAAADYLAQAVRASYEAGMFDGGSALVPSGLAYAGARRDTTWAILKAIELLGREAKNPESLGIALDTPERRQVAEVLVNTNDYALLGGAIGLGMYRSRQELLAQEGGVAVLEAGEFSRGLSFARSKAAEFEREGRIAEALRYWGRAWRFHTALGQFSEARETRAHCAKLAVRLPGPSASTGQLIAAEDEWRMALDDAWDQPFVGLGPGLGQGSVLKWYRAGFDASIGRTHARMGRTDHALRALTSVVSALEKGPAWADGYTRTACNTAETLWLTGRTDHIEVIEHNLREKVIATDFRYPMMDGRLALGRLCALQCRYDEACEWFARARCVLDEQGAGPLRATVDFDEALMYLRRGAADDTARAVPLLAAALEQFRAIGMTGWIRRAEEMLANVSQDRPAKAIAGEGSEDLQHDRLGGSDTQDTVQLSETGGTPGQNIVARFRREGEFWTLVYADAISRLRDMKGFHYLSSLLRNPDREFHALDLIRMQTPASDVSLAVDRGLPVLDPQAKTAYRRRLEELRAELEEAEAFNDPGRAERARDEMDAISEQIAAAVGFGGRDRKTASAAERARSAVTQRVRAAIKRIAAQQPALADHLAGRIETGTFCVYRPDPTRPIDWDLG